MEFEGVEKKGWSLIRWKLDRGNFSLSLAVLPQNGIDPKRYPFLFLDIILCKLTSTIKLKTFHLLFSIKSTYTNPSSSNPPSKILYPPPKLRSIKIADDRQIFSLHDTLGSCIKFHFSDLVKFVMCTLVSRVHTTFYILTKGYTVPFF